MSKPTFSDIARLAGVGTATVERVLNGRGGVRPATAAKVIAAARSLDYPKRLPEVHRGLLRIEVILVRPETTFFRRLSRAFERINATLDPSVRVHRTFMDEADPEAIAARIASTEPRKAGLILAVPDHPAIRSGSREPSLPPACRSSTSSRALRRVAGDLVSIDNYAAGRTAALFLSRMQSRSGTVMALCHPIYQVHRERMRGFSDFLRREAARRVSPSAGSASAAMRHDDAATCCSRRWRRGPTLSASTTSGRAMLHSPMSCASMPAGSRSSSSATN